MLLHEECGFLFSDYVYTVYSDIVSYIDDHIHFPWMDMFRCDLAPIESEDEKELKIYKNVIEEKKEDPFVVVLFDFIDKKESSEVECYKRANLDRRLFSKIRSNPNYKPRKRTVLALAIALKLNLEETEKLLKSTGYCLSHSLIADLIVEYCIVNERYNIFLINRILYDFGEKPLT